MEKEAKKTVIVRVDKALCDQVRQVAFREGRTVNRQIAYWVEQAVRESEARQAEEAKAAT